MAGNYERIIEKISRVSGLGQDELERRIAAKREKLSGLISKEGAAQVVAAELGISFENEKLKIDELLPGMRKVNILGKIINISPVRAFTTKRGEESKVVNLWAADETSNVKVVLWDTNHIKLIEDGQIAPGSIVEFTNGSMRDSELHLGSFSGVKVSSEEIADVKTEKVFHEKHISDFKRGESVSTRAFILQVFEPRFFNVCPECKKKVASDADGFMCERHGKVMPEKRGVANLTIDDGTNSMRAVLFHDALLKAGFSQPDNPERFLADKETFLGKEMMLTGNIRQNSFFNTLEFIVDEIREAEPDAIIAELEKR